MPFTITIKTFLFWNCKLYWKVKWFTNWNMVKLYFSSLCQASYIGFQKQCCVCWGLDYLNRCFSERDEMSLIPIYIQVITIRYCLLTFDTLPSLPGSDSAEMFLASVKYWLYLTMYMTVYDYILWNIDFILNTSCCTGEKYKHVISYSFLQLLIWLSSSQRFLRSFLVQLGVL